MTQARSTRTTLISEGRPQHPGAGLNEPIVPASTFALGSDRAYAREDGTPTWEAMESIIGAVEGGRAVAFASGMAAIAGVLDTVAIGGLVVAPVGCYSGAAQHLKRSAAAGRWRLAWLQPTDTDAWVAASASADLLWLESPTNPLLEVMDLPRILSAAVANGCRTVVDSTFATPLGQRALSLGASIVVHSASKYLGGHSDLLAGAAVTASDAEFQAIRDRRTSLGATPGMLEAFLVTRGLRTLALRVTASADTALLLAQRLQGHRSVTRVRYPGLATDPGHGVAASFMSSWGSVVSFDVAGGAPAADAVCASLRLIRHATSLGGVESTVERRGSIPGQEDVPPSLLRLSVGCEDPEDLWTDLSAALDLVAPSGGSGLTVS